MAAGVPARFGFTGANFAPEHRVEEQAEAGFGNEQARIGRPGGTPPVSRSPRTRGWLGRLARFVARPRRGWPARDGVAWLDHNLPAQWHAGGLHQTTVRVRNEGTRVWPAEHPEGKHVDLVVLVDRAVRHTVPLPHAVAPGQDATITFDLRMPTDDTKEWEVKLALIEQNVGWLQANGAAPLVVRVRRLPALGAGEDAASLTPTEDRPDGAAQARSDQPAGVRRRVWHLPVADGF
jgi:hypothetical protein